MLAAEHTAIWAYGVVGDALPAAQRSTAGTAEAAHRDSRDALARLLDSRGADPVAARAAYALPFPVASTKDAAALAVRLEDGTSAGVGAAAGPGAAAQHPAARRRRADRLRAARRVVARRGRPRPPLTTPFPGLP